MDLPTHPNGKEEEPVATRLGQTSCWYYLATSDGKDLQGLPVDLAHFFFFSRKPRFVSTKRQEHN